MYLVSSLVCLYGGRAILYDGSPFQPDLHAFLRIIEEQK
jgi:acetoacetyl-CoA synthetase